MKFEDEEIKKVFRDKENAANVPDDGIRRHPMLLKRGFVTSDPAWPKDPMTGFPQKMLAGETVMLPIEEARRLQKLRVAERADEIEL